MWWAPLLNNLIATLDAGAGGAAGSFESIATTTLSTNATTVTLSSIPSTYKHLQLRWIAQTYNATSNEGIYYQLNTDTAANYSYHNLGGDGSNAFANGGASVTYPALSSNVLPASGSTWGVGILDIHDYASTTKNKTLRNMCGKDTNGAGSIVLSSGVWLNTAAVNSLSIRTGTGFGSGSKFALYGIKG